VGLIGVGVVIDWREVERKILEIVVRMAGEDVA
jgi:hypothetical protein